MSLVLALAALVLGAWLSVIIITGRADRQGPAWSESFCAQGAPTVAPDQQIRRGDLTVRFSSSEADCNQINRAEVEGVIAEIEAAWLRLEQIGLPNPPRGRYITLTRNLKGDSIRTLDTIQINPYAKGVSTLDINLTADPDQEVYIYSQANLTLSEIAPGLNGKPRARLAGALTQLALNRQITTVDSEKLDQSGSYELWLGRRFGGQFLIEALAACKKPCSWPQARDSALRKAGYNPQVLADQWIAGLGPAERAEAKGLINSR